MSLEKISVIGLGYIGLPTAAMFASRQKKVIGVDVNEDVIDIINSGSIHIVEPELENMVSKAVTEGFLRASSKVEPADIFIIAVPTPFRDSNSNIPNPDLKYIKSASKAIAPVLKKGDLIILESTSPVGTTEKIAEWLSEIRSDLTFPNDNDNTDINIAHCPERVLPGQIIRELVENDRIIGGLSKRCAERAKKTYEIFVKGNCVITNARTAEMAKLTENSCRDVQIAFANELSIICDELNIDVWELIRLANLHPRINILEPGPGVGGHCIAVDPWFIVSKTPMHAKLIHTARTVNEFKPNWVVDKVKIAINDYLQKYDNKKIEDITIACFGLSFKPNIDDLRESPSMNITTKIANFHKGKVLAVEPNIQSIENSGFELVNIDDALQRANIVVMLVDHKEFKHIKTPNIEYLIDTKGIWK